MTKIKIILPVLIAVIIASTIGVVSAVGPVDNDGEKTGFIMKFSDFNATAIYPYSNQTSQISFSNVIYFHENPTQNSPDSRYSYLTIKNNGNFPTWEAIIVDGKTDGNTFEFTWLVSHTSYYAELATSEIVVNGVCDYSGDELNPLNDSPVTFTTTKGSLEISPNEVPDPTFGYYSSFTSVCQTP